MQTEGRTLAHSLHIVLDSCPRSIKCDTIERPFRTICDGMRIRARCHRKAKPASIPQCIAIIKLSVARIEYLNRVYAPIEPDHIDITAHAKWVRMYHTSACRANFSQQFASAPPRDLRMRVQPFPVHPVDQALIPLKALFDAEEYVEATPLSLILRQIITPAISVDLSAPIIPPVRHIADTACKVVCDDYAAIAMVTVQMHHVPCRRPRATARFRRMQMCFIQVGHHSLPLFSVIPGPGWAKPLGSAQRRARSSLNSYSPDPAPPG